MENSYITKRQYGILVFFIPFVFKFSVLPSMLSGIAGRDIWITMLLIMLAELVQLLFIVKVDKMGGLDAIKEKYGNIAYFALTLPILAVIVLKASVYSSETTSYANNYLFYNITTRGVGVIVIIASTYIAIKGAKGIGRVIELVIWMLPVALLIGVLFGKLKLEPSYVLPIGAEGITPIASSFNSALFWVLDFSPMLLLKTREDTVLKKRKRTRFPWVPACAIGSTFFMVALYIFYVMNYGASGHLIDTAFSSLGAFNVVNTEIGSIDWPAITIWLSVAIISLALKLFASGKIISKFKLKFPLSVGVAAIVVLVLSLSVFYNLERAFTFARSAVKYAVIAIELFVPMIAFILLDIAERKSNMTETISHKEVKSVEAAI